jgi:hypothetical protein
MQPTHEVTNDNINEEPTREFVADAMAAQPRQSPPCLLLDTPIQQHQLKEITAIYLFLQMYYIDDRKQERRRCQTTLHSLIS